MVSNTVFHLDLGFSFLGCGRREFPSPTFICDRGGLGLNPFRSGIYKDLNCPVIWCDGSFLLRTATGEFFPGEQGTQPQPAKPPAGHPLITEESLLSGRGGR